MSEDARERCVRIYATGRPPTEVDVSAGPLATEPAVVDLARKKLGIPGRSFESGELL